MKRLLREHGACLAMMAVLAGLLGTQCGLFWQVQQENGERWRS